MSSGWGAAVGRLLLDPVLAVVFATRCPACSKALDHPLAGPLCPACWKGLPRHRSAVCACGAPVPAGGGCGRCRRARSIIERGASLGPYEGGLRLLVHALKYDGRRRVALRLAARLADDPDCVGVLSADTLLVPVPLHPRRLRERGFNQCTLLCRELARLRGLPLETRALVRRRATVSQAGLSAAARRANVEGAFAVAQPARVRDRRVVLVDDVLTTGATARACARVLVRAGAREVRLLTVARVM